MDENYENNLIAIAVSSSASSVLRLDKTKGIKIIRFMQMP